jgi:hypothetical protein
VKAHQRIIKEEKLRTSNIEPFDDIKIKDAVCKDISRKEAEKIIMEYEWLGDMGISRYFYGMYIDDILVNVVCCGQTGARKDKYTAYVGSQFANKGVQIVRGASSELAPKHSSSKLISFVLKQMKVAGYKFAIAFSDPEGGEIGTVYQATNWYFTGNSTDSKGKDRAHYDMVINGKRYHLRSVVARFGTSKKSVLLERGYTVEYIYLPSKGRYFYLLGRTWENEEMLKYLNRFIKPYPKRQE